jgi:hypothetical protein
MNKRRFDEEAGLGRVASPRKQNPEGVSPAKRLKSNDDYMLSIWIILPAEISQRIVLIKYQTTFDGGSRRKHIRRVG